MDCSGGCGRFVVVGLVSGTGGSRPGGGGFVRFFVKSGGIWGVLREIQKFLKKRVTFWRLGGTEYVDNYTFFGKKGPEVKVILRVSAVVTAGKSG